MGQLASRIDRLEKDQHARLVSMFTSGWRLTADQAQRCAAVHLDALRSCGMSAERYSRTAAPTFSGALGFDATDRVMEITAAWLGEQ